MKSLSCLVLLLCSVALAEEQFSRTGPRRLSTHPCNIEGTCSIHDFKRVGRSSDDFHEITIWTKQNGFADSCPAMLMARADPGPFPSLHGLFLVFCDSFAFLSIFDSSKPLSRENFADFRFSFSDHSPPSPIKIRFKVFNI